MRNKKNKGFTLVELIVVLVILAILAAILVPALLGYIDRAKGQQIVLNARCCMTAAQTEFSAMYGEDTQLATVNGTEGKWVTLAGDDSAKRIMDTADVPNCTYLVVGCDDRMTPGNRAGYKITFVYYAEGSKSVYFDGKSWEETDKGPYDFNDGSKVLYFLYPDYSDMDLYPSTETN
jgi:prepilin-type N-terminal cleavage/methylation domain-containing protein